MKVGEVVMLYPKGMEDRLFFSSLGGFTDDFYDSIASAREENMPDSQREPL